MVEINEDIFKDVGIEKVEVYNKVGFSIAAYNGNEVFIDNACVRELFRIVEANDAA
jgi:hypothetical protein